MEPDPDIADYDPVTAARLYLRDVIGLEVDHMKDDDVVLYMEDNYSGGWDGFVEESFTKDDIAFMSRQEEVIPSHFRELDFRSEGGVRVRLLWDPAKDHVIVSAVDTDAGVPWRFFRVSRERARDAFLHPYAYGG